MFGYGYGRLRQGVSNSIDSYRLTPRAAILYVTYRCTSRCVACNLWQEPVDVSQELDWAAWRTVLDRLIAGGVSNIEFYGGDALLRKNLLLDMIRHCAERGVGTWFPTNSSSLTKRTIDDLVEAGLGTVYLSFDEVPSIHENVRGVSRHFDRVTTAIRRFQAARGARQQPRISCITTVSSLNYQHLDTLLEASHDLGADEHILRGVSEFTPASIDGSAVGGIHPDPHFLPTDNRSHAFSHEQATELLETVRRIWRSRERYAPMAIDVTNLRGLTAEDLVHLHYPRQLCVFATTQVVVTPYGDVLPCLYFKKYRLGNLLDRELGELWGNDLHRTFCNAQRQDSIRLCDECSNKCYHQAFAATVRDLAHLARERFL